MAAVLVGEGDCAVAATFTDPSGTTREVDLRPWRGQCARGVPGQETTVWYDASDPSVTAPNDHWWWPALVAAAPVVVLGGLVLVGSRPRPRPTPPRAEVARPEPAVGSGDQSAVGIIHREGDEASLVMDYALGRLEVILDDVRADQSIPAGVAAALARTQEALLRGDISGAARHCAEAAHLVSDGGGHDSEAGRWVLAYRRNIFGD